MLGENRFCAFVQTKKGQRGSLNAWRNSKYSRSVWGSSQIKKRRCCCRRSGLRQPARNRAVFAIQTACRKTEVCRRFWLKPTSKPQQPAAIRINPNETNSVKMKQAVIFLRQKRSRKSEIERKVTISGGLLVTKNGSDGILSGIYRTNCSTNVFVAEQTSDSFSSARKNALPTIAPLANLAT